MSLRRRCRRPPPRCARNRRLGPRHCRQRPLPHGSTSITSSSAIFREDTRQSRVDRHAVMQEYETAGVIERTSGGFYRFKWGYGKTLQELQGPQSGTACRTSNWTDMDANPVMSAVNPPRRGAATRSKTAMVVVGLSILATTMWTAKSEAASGHCFRVWHYKSTLNIAAGNRCAYKGSSS